MTGVYIHIPLCFAKCDYCAFYSEPVGQGAGAVRRALVDGLLREMDARLDGKERVGADTVYFGGGTPSLLEPDQVDRILGVLRERLDIAAGAEITLEMNPRDLSAERLEAYRDAGVNRAVLGVQTLSERLHRIIGRSCPPCTGRELDIFFGVPGITHCADLIAGIPSQRDDELIHDIDTIAGYGAAHLSVYLLTIEHGTPLWRRMSMDDKAESLQKRHFEAARARLRGLGYDHYEISNYARTGFESRHNMKYWRFEPYYGFGPGAHSFVDGERYFNPMTLSGYIGPTQLPPVKDDRGPGSVTAEYIMTGLRLLRGISLGEMERHLGVTLPGEVMERIRKAVEEGSLVLEERDGDNLIRLSERGVIFSDSVIFSIVEHLL